MSRVVYVCYQCKKEVEFDADPESQLLLDDAVKRPVTYIVSCPYCNTQISVTHTK